MPVLGRFALVLSATIERESKAEPPNSLPGHAYPGRMPSFYQQNYPPLWQFFYRLNEIMQSYLFQWPTPLEKWLMGISGGIGAMMGVVLGEHAYVFYWLLAFVLIDYVTGLAAACINKVASSSVGFKGLIKKVIIVCVCLLCHGLDQVSHMPFIGLGLVFAFMANEMISILENISKAGYGSVIPKAIRQIIEAAEDQQINLIKEKLGCGADKKTEKDK